MSTKRNRLVEYYSNFQGLPYSKGTLYNRLKVYSGYIDFVTYSERNSISQEQFSAHYVDNPYLQDAIADALAASDAIVGLVGAKGIGKSTIIRRLYGLDPSPRILNDGTVVVPIHLNTNALGSDSTQITSMISNAVRAATENIYRTSNVVVTDDEICEFIINSKSPVLSRSGENINKSKNEILLEMRKDNLYACVAMEFKMACQRIDAVNSILILIDDMETMNLDSQRQIIASTLKMRECLKNLGVYERSYSVDVLFTCRPATFKWLVEDAVIDGFNGIAKIDFKKPVSVLSIFTRKMDYAIKRVGEGMKISPKYGVVPVEDRERWSSDINSVNSIIKFIVENYGVQIVELCNYDLREACGVIKKILENSRWYDAGHSAGVFSISDSEYILAASVDMQGNSDRVSRGILKSLIMQSSIIYNHDLNPTFPNFFFNFRDEDADLMTCYVICFFFERAKRDDLPKATDVDLKNALEVCYPRATVDVFFKEVVNYLINSKMIRLEIVRRDGQQDLSYLVAQPKLFRGWKMIKKHFEIIECLKDSCYFPSKNVSAAADIKQEDVFLSCLEFIDHINKCEQKTYKHMIRSGFFDVYKRLFGGYHISSHVFKPVQESIFRYYNNPSRGVTTPPSNISRYLSEIKGIIRRDAQDYGSAVD